MPEKIIIDTGQNNVVLYMYSSIHLYTSASWNASSLPFSPVSSCSNNTWHPGFRAQRIHSLLAFLGAAQPSGPNRTNGPRKTATCRRRRALLTRWLQPVHFLSSRISSGPALSSSAEIVGGSCWGNQTCSCRQQCSMPCIFYL